MTTLYVEVRKKGLVAAQQRLNCNALLRHYSKRLEEPEKFMLSTYLDNTISILLPLLEKPTTQPKINFFWNYKTTKPTGHTHGDCC
jgi:hypothetical protein